MAGITRVINARSQSIDPNAAQRAQDIADRHERARAAMAENGGRSAPQSAASRATGLSSSEAWAGMFPNAPTPQPFMSTPPRISARDAAMNASPQPFMPGPRTAPLISARGPAAVAPTPAGIPDVALDPRLPAAEVTATGITRNMPAAPTANTGFDPNASRIALKQSHPAIFEAGSPENAAFVAHAKEFGQESAFANLDKILPPAAKVADTTPVALTPLPPGTSAAAPTVPFRISAR